MAKIFVLAPPAGPIGVPADRGEPPGARGGLPGAAGNPPESRQKPRAGRKTWSFNKSNYTNLSKLNKGSLQSKHSAKYILPPSLSPATFAGKKSCQDEPHFLIQAAQPGFSHIESWLRSGLRPSEYYRRHTLSEHQFYSWRRRYLSAHPELSDTGTKNHCS